MESKRLYKVSKDKNGWLDDVLVTVIEQDGDIIRYQENKSGYEGIGTEGVDLLTYKQLMEAREAAIRSALLIHKRLEGARKEATGNLKVSGIEFHVHVGQLKADLDLAKKRLTKAQAVFSAIAKNCEEVLREI